MSLLESVAAAPIGVFAYVRRDGTPNAVPVTPFVVDGRIVVTSTLAYVAKAAAVRRDSRVALLAGGVHVSSTATVLVDQTPSWFNAHIREDEIRKFPPTKTFLDIPFNQCLFGWYSGRVIIEFDPAPLDPVTGDDRVSVTTVDASGGLRITPVPADIDLDSPDIPLDGPPEGPAVVLVHDESDDMRDLRQLALVGTIRNGRLAVSSRRGSLTPSPTTARAQLATVRSMARLARGHRSLIADWPHPRAS